MDNPVGLRRRPTGSRNLADIHAPSWNGSLHSLTLPATLSTTSAATSTQEGATTEPPLLTTADFRDAYPRYPDINTLEIPEADLNSLIDFRPYMNDSPYHMNYSKFIENLRIAKRGI